MASSYNPAFDTANGGTTAGAEGMAAGGPFCCSRIPSMGGLITTTLLPPFNNAEPAFIHTNSGYVGNSQIASSDPLLPDIVAAPSTLSASLFSAIVMTFLIFRRIERYIFRGDGVRHNCPQIG